jgi:hypothetical protein
MEMQGVLAGYPVKGIKLGQLLKGDARPQKRGCVEFLGPQAESDPSHDSIDKLLQLFHQLVPVTVWVSRPVRPQTDVVLPGRTAGEDAGSISLS